MVEKRVKKFGQGPKEINFFYVRSSLIYFPKFENVSWSSAAKFVVRAVTEQRRDSKNTMPKVICISAKYNVKREQRSLFRF